MWPTISEWFTVMYFPPFFLPFLTPQPRHIKGVLIISPRGSFLPGLFFLQIFATLRHGSLKATWISPGVQMNPFFLCIDTLVWCVMSMVAWKLLLSSAMIWYLGLDGFIYHDAMVVMVERWRGGEVEDSGNLSEGMVQLCWWWSG